jgi:hypothetical protein
LFNPPQAQERSMKSVTKAAEMSLDEFRELSSLLPLGDDGAVADYADETAEAWTAKFEGRAREASRANGAGEKESARLAKVQAAQALAGFAREIDSTLVFPVFMPQINHCVIAFKVSEFEAARRARSASLQALGGGQWDVPTQFLLNESAGDPVKFVHTSIAAAEKGRQFDGLLDEFRRR